MKIIKHRKMLRLKITFHLGHSYQEINNILIENAEYLDIVMLMYYLLEYNDFHSMTSGSLWNYYRDEIDGVDDNASQGKSLKYKTRVTGKTT